MLERCALGRSFYINGANWQERCALGKWGDLHDDKKISSPSIGLPDSKTGLKWVNVTTDYFPGDLPGNIPHPCISEVNEFLFHLGHMEVILQICFHSRLKVYESNSDRTEMAGSIQGKVSLILVVRSNVEEKANGEVMLLNLWIFPLYLLSHAFNFMLGTCLIIHLPTDQNPIQVIVHAMIDWYLSMLVNDLPLA
ncbi:hypothetical protein K1719_006267 [Acacia pycnantha]|nr:hypothetical protein K1719_006267 [Acacia pycnantha]